MLENLKESKFDEYQDQNMQLDMKLEEKRKEADFLMKVYQNYEVTK